MPLGRIVTRLGLTRQSSLVDGVPGGAGPDLVSESSALILGGAVGLQASRGVYSFDGGIRLDAGTGHHRLQPRVGVARKLGERWRAEVAFGRSAQWTSALNAEQVVPQAPVWWVHGPDEEWTTTSSLGATVVGAPWSFLAVRAEGFASWTADLTTWEEDRSFSGLRQVPARASGVGLDVAATVWSGVSLRWDHTLAWAVHGQDRVAPIWDVRNAGAVRTDFSSGPWDMGVSLSYASGRPVPLPIGLFQGLRVSRECPPESEPGTMRVQRS